MLTLLQPLDGAILLWIQNTLRGALDPLVCFYTHLGDKGLLWIAACLLLLLWKPTRKAGLLGLFAMVLGFLVTNVTLKHLFARPRPWLDVPGLTALVNEPDPNSFPSGHTCSAFAAALAWAPALPKRWMGVCGLALAAAMGLSRLDVGVHYPSDVLAGCIIGCLCALAARALWTHFEKRRKLC